MTVDKKYNFEILGESREQLKDLLKRQGGMRVSILLPVANEPPESEQNPSRLKDLHQRALDQLIENGLKLDNAKNFLRPVELLLEDPKSLLRPAESLALFIDEGSASLVDLPYEVDTRVTVGNRFVVKPLLPLLQHDSDFTVACLNRGDVKVYEGTRLGLREVEVPDMPTSIQETTEYDDPEKSLQHHTAKTGPAEGRPGTAPVQEMHGQGMPADIEKSQNERFFRDVANAVKKFLANKHAPLVVFGVDENVGLFTSCIVWGEQKIISVHHDPKDWSKVELLRHASEALMPHWEEKISEKVDRLKEAHAKDTGVFDTGKCVLAAANGRVEMVCVASDKSEPGICQPEEMKVEFVDADEAACAHDLLDTIAYETIQHGGEAFAMLADEIPGPGEVAATVRFEG
ncbi:MAG TPA: hypothetical protein VJ952_01575 [Opitutales bacterium]|nr:hypothetical protein [Opitutales bacterium]